MAKLLMMSRLDEKQEVRVEKQDLSDLISGVWQDYQLPMQQKGLRGEAEIQAGLNAKADREMIAQMVRLLMDNAVEYTAPEGEILLRAGAEGYRVRLTLENTVERLPEAEPEQLTERFVRGNTARTQKSGGSGIGLAAVRRIADIHRGRLRVEYPEPTRFRVSVELPKAA